MSDIFAKYFQLNLNIIVGIVFKSSGLGGGEGIKQMIFSQKEQWSRNVENNRVEYV